MFRFVQSSTTGVVQTFGKFSRTAQPGLRFYVPGFQKMDVVSNRIRQMNTNLEIKTKDNVFVKLSLAIQYQVKPENTERAYFSLSQPVEQINAYVENAVRSQVPKMELDELFESHNDIPENVNLQVNEKMNEYGFDIINTLVTDISPTREVQDAMNKINASQRLMEATKNEAEAAYIREIKQAEADRDRKRLQGEGTSQQRQAIVEGYQEGIQNMANSLGLTPREVSEMVLRIQHMDMMEIIGKSQNTKILYLGSQNNNLSQQIMQAIEGTKTEPAT